MQGYIEVIVKDDKIEVMGQEFTLGELTVSLLNGDDAVYKEMGKQLVNLERLAEISREKHIFYRKFINTDERRKFELALDERIKFPTYEEWVEIHQSVCRIQELMQGIKVLETIVLPVKPDFVKRFENIEYGSDEYDMAWVWYLELLDITMGFVEDIFALVRTIRNFTTCIIPGLRKYDTHHLAAAYHMLLFDPRCAGLVASMEDPDKVTYTIADYMILQYIPMKVEDRFIIAEYYRVDNLQAVIKIDLLRGLMKGYFPRRCENCGRYFLMTRGYRTKYCDSPSPDDPRRTCHQSGYSKTRVKENKADDPKLQSLKRCRERIRKACSRGTLTEAEKDKLIRTAEEIYTAAVSTSKYTYEQFEEMLKKENLYPRCGIKAT